MVDPVGGDVGTGVENVGFVGSVVVVAIVVVVVVDVVVVVVVDAWEDS